MDKTAAMPQDLNVTSHKTGNQSVAEWVACELRRNIADGKFAPGDRLPGERQLSEHLNVSRVSVRAAIQNLKAQGLLSSVQGGGTRVVATAPQMDSPLAELVMSTPDNLGDLIDLRSQTMLWAVVRACGALQADQLAVLQSTFDEMQAATQPFEVSALDQKFQANMLRICGTPVFLHLMGYLDDVLATALMEQDCQRSVTRDDATSFVQSARDVLSALAGGNQAVVQAIMRQRAQLRREIMMGQLQSDPIGIQQAAE